MNNVVLITGGSSGIGKAIGVFLTEKGYKVYGTSRNPQNVKETLPFKLVALDVTDSKSIKTCISAVLQIEKRIDVLINNAGVGITGAIEETPMEEIQKAFRTNVYGPIEIANAVLPIMRLQKSGHIINITSIAGYMGLPYRGIYCATKAALEITTEAYRMELKQFNIHMSTVAPGDFATNIAAGRFHSPLLKNSPYHKQYKDTLEMMDAHVNGGMDPVEMAKAVHSVIENPSPKVRYRVGAFMQKFSIVLKKVLPSKMYESLLMNHYNLK
jgi:short-subunit dehydrogenase